MYISFFHFIAWRFKDLNLLGILGIDIVYGFWFVGMIIIFLIVIPMHGETFQIFRLMFLRIDISIFVYLTKESPSKRTLL